MKPRTILLLVCLCLLIPITGDAARMSPSAWLGRDSEPRAQRSAAGEPPELIFQNVVSREFSTQNQVTAPLTFTSVVSREFSIENSSIAPLVFVNVASREFTIQNDIPEPLVFTNVASREFSVDAHEPAPPVVFINVASREFSILNSIPIALAFINVASREFSVQNEPAPPVAFTNTVSREFSIHALGPDLQVAGITPRVGGSPGEVVEVAWVATNAGDAPAVGPWVETVSGSADAAAGNDFLLGSFDFNDVIDAGQSVQRVENVTIPANLPAGTYFALVCLDTDQELQEISDLNNCSAEPVCVDCQPPDLGVTSIVEPAFGFDGQTFDVTWTVANNGQGPAPGSWVDALALSSDPVAGSDTSLGIFGHTGPLAAGEQYTTTQSIEIPAGTNGQFYIVVSTDAQAAVIEPGGEANNTGIATAATTIFQPELPDLQVTQVTAPAEVLAGQSHTLAYKVTNTDDAGTALGPWTDKVYLSTDGQLDPEPDGLDQLIQSLEFASALGPQTFYVRTVPFTAPQAAATYWIFVVADAEGDVPELADANNTGFQAIEVAAPSYTAVVSSLLEEAQSDTTVLLQGQALSVMTGQPVPDVPVTVRVRVQGTRRVSMPLITDASGGFSYNFFPLPGEAGLYKVYADHPGVMEDANNPQDTFKLLNLRAEPLQFCISLDLNAPKNRQVTLRNLADVAVSGITAVVEGAPPGLDVQLTVPGSLPALGVAPLVFTLTAAEATIPNGTLTARVRMPIAGVDTEVEVVQVMYFVVPPAPELTKSPGSLAATMLRGAETGVQLTVTNTGGAPATGVQVLVPCDVDVANPGCVPGLGCSINAANCSEGLWLNLVTPQVLGDIMPGESRTIELSLLPSTDLTLGPYTGTVQVQANEDALTIPYTFTAVSNEKGSLSVIVEDENTYYGPGGDSINGGGPNLAGASITLKNPYTAEVVAQGTSGPAGTLLLADLFEGFYDLQVSADDHGSFSTTIEIHADEITEVRAFLPAQQVSYNWTVTPVDIEDVYIITIEAEFETFVPAPVVTVEPELTELNLGPGESLQIDLVITNHGFIAAQDARLVFGSHPDYVFSPLITELGALAAASTVVVPLTITRSAARGPSGAGDSCFDVVSYLLYYLICEIPRQYAVNFWFDVPNDACTPSGGCGCACNPCGGGGIINPGGPVSSAPTSIQHENECPVPPVNPDKGPPECVMSQIECCRNDLPFGSGQGSPSSPGEEKTDPVRLYSGEQYFQMEDLRVPGRGMDVTWRRLYRSKIGPSTAQGNGWDSSYNVRIEYGAGTNLILHNGRGRADEYEPQPDGRWGRDEFFQDIVKNPDATYTLTMPDQQRWSFHTLTAGPAAGKLASIADRNGNTMMFFHDAQGRLERVNDTLGRDILIAYNAGGFIESVTDFAGRQVRYEYYQDGDAGGSSGDLKSVTAPAVVNTPEFPIPPGHEYPAGKTTVYTYTKGFADERLNHNLTSITDPRGQTFVTVEYYAEDDPQEVNFDRVKRQTWGDPGDVVDLFYVRMVPSIGNRHAVLRTIINDRAGNVSEYDFDIRNRMVRQRDYTGRANPDAVTTLGSNRPAGKLRPGDPDFFETLYDWNNDAKVTKVTHANGNVTDYVYELELNPDVARRGRGNLRTIRRLPGTHTPAGDQAVIEEHFEYDDGFGCPGCGFNFVTRHTDARGHDTVHTYDDSGNRIHTQHRLPEIVEDYEYNPFGQMIAHILPDNGSGHRRRDEFTYYDSGPQRGYLHQQIVDAGGFNLTTTHEYNVVGDVIRTIDPRGSDTQYVVNQHNQVLREISRPVQIVTGIDPPSTVTVRYERDTYYDANDNVVRVDEQNVDDQGVLAAANTHFTTIYEYEILNELVRTCEEKGAAQLGLQVRTCAAIDAGDQDEFITTEYGYDPNRNRTLARHGEATSGADPYNAVATQYDERDLVFREIRAPGHPTQVHPNSGETLYVESIAQYDYDRNGNMVRHHEGMALDGDTIVVAPHVTTSTLDGFDRQVAMLDPMGNQTVRHYDATSNRTQELVFGELDDVPGSAANVRLSETAFTYDPMDRLERTDVAFFDAATQAPILDGLATTQTVWTPNSQVRQVINDNGHATTTAYDTANRRHIVTDAKGNTVEYQYDQNSNVRFMIETNKHDLPGRPDEMFTTEMVYDQLDRQIATIDNVGSINRSFYDSRNNRTRTLDALDHEILYQHDGLSRQIRIIRDTDGSGLGSAVPTARAGDDDPDVLSIVTEQGWDDSSRLVTQTDDNGNTTTTVYDSLDRKIAEIYADFTEKHWFYDPHDTNIFWDDANQNQVAQTFDDNDRLIRRDVIPGPGVSDDTTYEIYGHDGLSRLILAEDDDTRATRMYDSLSHVTTEIQELFDDPSQPWPPAVVTSLYDAVGNQLQLGYPSGRLVTTTYDELERKKIISDQDGMIAEYWYVGPGRVAQRDYGNGTRCEWTYDGITGVENPVNDFGVKHIVRMKQFRISDGMVIDDRTYTWDSMGNKTQMVDVRPGGTLETRDYTYDSVHRLVQSERFDSSGPLETIVYELDGVGNRTYVSGGEDAGDYIMEPGSGEPADFSMNQYTTTPFDARDYDANGNLVLLKDITPVLLPSRAISFDFSNRAIITLDLANTDRFEYAYDPLSRRVSKSIDSDEAAKTERFVSFLHQEIAESASSGQETTHVYGNYIDEVLQSRGQATFYAHADHLFSVSALTTTNGSVSAALSYGDYGRSIGTTHASHSFTGRRFDKEADNYYHRTRFLDSHVGRFTSRDTIGLWGDPGLFGSAYVYASNNPIVFVDPFGLWTTPVHHELLERLASVPKCCREMMKEGSDSMDKYGGWDPFLKAVFGDQHEHAMCDRDEDKTECTRRINNIMKKAKEMAQRQFDKSGRTCNSHDYLEGCRLFGKWAHMVHDKGSPEHSFEDCSPKDWHTLDVAHPFKENMDNLPELLPCSGTSQLGDDYGNMVRQWTTCRCSSGCASSEDPAAPRWRMHRGPPSRR